MEFHSFSVRGWIRLLMICGLVCAMTGGVNLARATGGDPATIISSLDMYDKELKWVEVDPANATGGNITGVIPAGWRDDSGWSKGSADYGYDQQDGQKYFALKVKKLGNGNIQFRIPVPDFPDGSLFRLTLRARSNPGVSIELGIRHNGTPFKFLRSEKLVLDPGWRTYEYLFNLDHNTQPVSLFFKVMELGEVDIATMQLERISQDQLMAELKAKHPGGGPKNILRTSRLPLGLQSGWVLDRESLMQNIEPLAETDAQVTGVSGFPSFHLNSPEKFLFWSEPFTVPVPFQKYTASVYVKGSGQGELQVMRENKVAAKQAFTADKAWTRVEVPFDPRLGVKMYSLRVEVTGSVWLDAWQVSPGDKAEPYVSQLPAEVSLACVARETAVARVQFTDEPARMDYCVTMTTVPQSGAKFKLHAKVINLYGQEAEIVPIAMEPRSVNRGTFEFSLFPDRPNGSLRVEAWVEDESGHRVSTYQELIVHRLQRPRYWGKDAPDSPFGIHVEADTAHVQMAKASGVNWVRLHDAGVKFFGWYFLEPEKGKWKFADEAINRYRKANLKILGCLVSSPEWASFFEKRQSPYHDKFFQPKNPNDYANYVKVVSEHYRGVIDAYDVWNEPWNAAWFSAGFDQSKKGRAGYQPSANPAASYVELCKLAYDRLKAVDPLIKVIGINTTTQEKMTKPYPDLSGVDWTRMVLELHGENYCDIMGYHQYEPTFQCYPSDIVERGYQVALGPFRQAGVKKPAWFTEGCSVVGYIASGFYHYTIPYNDTENVMDTGNRMCREVISVMTLGVEKSFLYSMACYKYFGSSADNPWNVLVTEDGSLHPSASAYSAMAWRLEDTKFEKWIALGSDNYACLFKGKNGTVAVIAPAQVPSVLELPDVPDWKVSDLIGNPIKDNALRTNQLAYIESSKSPAEVEGQLKRIIIAKKMSK